MEKYSYTVRLAVEIEAFDESDAWEALQDALGVGEMGAVTVIDCTYKETRNRRK